MKYLKIGVIAAALLVGGLMLVPHDTSASSPAGYGLARYSHVECKSCPVTNFDVTGIATASFPSGKPVDVIDDIDLHLFWFHRTANEWWQHYGGLYWQGGCSGLCASKASPWDANDNVLHPGYYGGNCRSGQAVAFYWRYTMPNQPAKLITPVGAEICR